MGFRKGLDKLFGAGEYAEAKKTVSTLEEKQKLTGRDKKDKRAAEEILLERRKFLQQALAVTATMAAGAYLGVSNKEKLGCLPDKKSPENPHTSNYPSEQIPNIFQSPENHPTGAQMRGILDRGFEKDFKDVPLALADAKTPQMQMLSAIKAFRTKMVRWAELKGRAFISLETGHKSGGWMVVLTPESASYHTQKEALVIDTSSPDGIVALLIRPFEVTETWAGIFQTHELSHLHDMVFKLEPRKPNRDQYLHGELRAYFVEKVLVDHLTNGRYSKELPELIKRNNLNSLDDVKKYLATNREHSFEDLNQVVSPEKPRSFHENALRQGFHSVMVSFEVEVKAVKERGETPNLKEILAKILNMSSGGSHVPRQ